MNTINLKNQNNCAYNINYHLAIVTKYRNNVINKEVLERITEIIKERLTSWDGNLIEVNSKPDYIHVLFELPPKHAVSDFSIALKTNTSRLIRKEFAKHLEPFYWKPVFWAKNFCIVSCGEASLDVVKSYLIDQKGT